MIYYSIFLCYIGSCGLCSAADTANSQIIYSLTFGNGTDPYSTATPSSFNFTTTYNQKNTSPLVDDAFSFVNAVPADFTVWLAGALDHTPTTSTDGSKGYMMLVGADVTPGEVFRITINDLVIGSRYEFSSYVANVVKKGSNIIKPNIRFEIRTASADNTLLASTTSGDIDEYDTLTWMQYGTAFYAPATSIALVMISIAPGGGGNDFVVDDITVRTCASSSAATCVPGKLFVVVARVSMDDLPMFDWFSCLFACLC